MTDEDAILESFEYEEAMEKLVYEIRGAVFKAHDAGISGLAMREECLNALLDAISDVVEINNKENASA